MKLADLKPGQTGVITKILGHGAFRKRVMEMGFVRGREVSVILNAPLQDPVKYSLMGYEVSLRRAESELLEVETLEEWIKKKDAPLQINHVSDETHTIESLRKDRIINVALVGNPNCGKTSLFNIVSGAHEHVGNYAGVTVGAKEGSMTYGGYKFNIVDLPGTYSLSAYSPEELYVMRYLREETPDIIVNVVVASNLERNLYLTTELIDMNRSMVIALNMYDELERSHAVLEYEQLGKMLGVPIIPTKASTGWGINNLLDTIIQVYELKNPDTRHIHIKMRAEVEQGVNALKNIIKNDTTISQKFAPRYLAIKMLERDPEVEHMLQDSKEYSHISEVRDHENERIERDLGDDPNSVIASEKYGFIQGALAETLKNGEKQEEQSTKIIDAFVTNKLFGFPIFLLVMWLMFWATFQIGSYPMEWIEMLVSWISTKVGLLMTDGPLKDLLLDGIIGGVGGVIVFLPN
ncbi:MAG: fused ferrous iron transport protein A/B, partial [Muribaculaceae bacterium]|nr:fused ferrous iron transport protein A/B [Muribaculaceae bacterium]